MPLVERSIVTLPIWMLMTEGLGMETVPMRVAPSGSGVSLTCAEVMLKPASLFRPRRDVS